MELSELQKRVDAWIREYGVRYFSELTNVLWVLVCLANQTGVNLTEALEANFAKKTARDKERHRNNPKL
mgnify:CR=1 FL=1